MYNNRFKLQKRFRGGPRQKTLGNHELMRAISFAAAVRENKTITEEEPIVIGSFEKFGLAKEVLQNILDKGYRTPTPIQEQTISSILSGKDVIGIADTGTGKTAAFLIPLVNKVFLKRTEKVLIIVPTRELAVQIREELISFSKGLGIYSTLLIGGANIRNQKENLRRNPHFVIGTPGRINDLISERNLSLSVFNNVVLDEADRMVDIGFIKPIKYFISLLPKNRQSLFFSATVPGKVKEVLNQFVRDAITSTVKQQDAIHNIKQDIVKIEGNKKIDKLHDLLKQKGFDKVLVFGRTKWGIQKLTNELIRHGFKAAAIHGNKNQNQRQRALQQFKNDQIQVLLATDVASRGLDIDNVTHVINYDMPASMEDYIHRIGRTGRANKKGIALTFIDQH